MMCTFASAYIHRQVHSPQAGDSPSFQNQIQFTQLHIHWLSWSYSCVHVFIAWATVMGQRIQYGRLQTPMPNYLGNIIKIFATYEVWDIISGNPGN